ncbi:MAG: TolC family protein [Alphaproteobacteria bacterium]|nr:TolC family protein [Alphaproteobacteria bacterium]
MVDPQLEAIQKRAAALYNQGLSPAPQQAAPQQQYGTVAVSSAQSAQDAAIKNNVYNLYQEAQPKPAPLPPAPALQPPIIPQNTPQTTALNSPPQPLPPVAQTPPTAAIPAAQNWHLVAAAPAPVAPAPIAAVTPSTQIASSPTPSPYPAAVQPAAVDMPSPSSTGFSDEQAANFIRNLAGANGVSLNVVDAIAPADIQAPMHLDEAVAFALKNNFEVRAADEKSTGAYWDKMGAYSEYLPTVQLSADTGPERSQPASYNDAFGNRVMDNTHNRRDHSIIITQPLIDLSIIGDILSGTDKQDIADTDERDVREGVASDTASTFLDLLQSRISIRLANQYKGYLEDLAQRMEARVAGGGATSADLDRIRGRETAAESARIEALGQYQAGLADFKRLTKIMPAQLVIPAVLAPPVPASEQTAMKLALKNNPSYISSLEKVDLAESDRDKSFSGLMPKLLGQYTNSYSFNAGGAAEGNPVDGVYPTQKTQTVMLVAQWSLTGGTSIAGGLSGIAKEREMDLRSLDIRARIEQGIQTGYAAINAAHEREAVLLRSVADDERVVRSFEEQYKNGGRSLFDMLDAYEQLYNARLNLMRVVIAGAKASYQVRRQMGQLQQSILSSEGP